MQLIVDSEVSLESSCKIVADPSLFLLEVALQTLLGSKHNTTPEIIFNAYDKHQRNDGLQFADTPWSCLSRPQLLQNLIDLGAPIEKSFWGNNAIVLLLWNLGYHRSTFQTAVGMLLVLIGHGIDIHKADEVGLTPSMIARYMCLWTEWCEALKCNGLHIKDVLEKDGNTWLIEDDWKELWIDCRHSGWEYLRTDDYTYVSELVASSVVEDDTADFEVETRDIRESWFSSDIGPGFFYIEYSDKSSEHHTTEHVNNTISS
jgi:hypothetical protein